MAEKLTEEKVRKLLVLEDTEFRLEDFRRKHQIDPESSNLYVAINRMVESKRLKRIGRGLYKKVRPVHKITTLNVANAAPFDLSFPMSAGDMSLFGWEDLIEVDEGDVMLIAGAGNSSKTAFVINMLAENMDKHPCVLMGNEYARVDEELSPKFARRMGRMETWAKWYKEDGKTLKFDILPVNEDYEMWVEPDKINFIDWVNLSGEAGQEFYLAGQVIKKIKYNIGKGIAVIVLQKNDDRLLGRGGAPTKDLADLYVAIDNIPNSYEKKLTIVKCKAAKEYMDGRMWAFSIIEGGTQFSDIREVVTCPRCRGRSAIIGGKCVDCNQKGFKDK